MVKFVCQTEQG